MKRFFWAAVKASRFIGSRVSSMAFPHTNIIGFPFKEYCVNSYRFREDCTYDNIRWGIHLAEDCNIAAGTPVKTIGRGKVVYSAMHLGSAEKRNWGGIVIIAHKNPKTIKVFFSLYGHLGTLQVRKGDLVELNQTIGTIGKALSPENGWWKDAHLHLALYTGPWLGKVLPGYFREDQKLTKLDWWHEPTSFIRNYNK